MNPLPREMTLVIHQEDGMFWTEVPELPGCFASGHNLNELKEALAEAIGIYLTDSPDQQLKVSVELGPPPDAAEFPARLQLAAA